MEGVGGFDLTEFYINFFIGDDSTSLEHSIKSGVLTPNSIKGDTSLLIFAIKCETPRCFDLLLRLGANVNYLDKTQRSALFYAIYDRNAKFAIALIEAGADLKIEFEYRFTPLVMCVTQKTTSPQMFESDYDLIIKALLLRGSKLKGVPAYVSIAPWMKELETKVEKHRQLALSVYASQRKTEQKECFPPKEIVALISKMIWEKRV